MDNSTALFFKFVFWGLASPFILTYWVIKGIVYLCRMQREASEASAAAAAQADYERSMEPEVVNQQVSPQNTLYGQQAEPEPTVKPPTPSRRAA